MDRILLMFVNTCHGLVDTKVEYRDKPALEEAIAKQQEDTKKVEAEAKKEEQSNSTNTDKADNKKDQLLDISV
ncbi:hypothetical protein CAMP5063_04070 [Campylobacter sp. RM5063]|nr:hypothetical protein [Campylobacter sp. RM5063]HEC1793349.1 hypothetical protein [Campylobacter lari]